MIISYLNCETAVMSDDSLLVKLSAKNEQNILGMWWLSGRFGALCPEGRRFEFHTM